MRVATFNANSIRTRLNGIIQWLNDQQPDVLCIQETKVQDHQFPVNEIREAGYHSFFRGQKSYNGVAVLSRTPPDYTVAGLDSEPKDETRLLHVRFGKVNIVNTYVPQGRSIDHEMYHYKLAWFKRLKKYFDENFSPDDMVLWLGDLNVARDYIDIHNAAEQEDHVCFHKSARKAFNDVLDWGFVDIFREKHPEPGEYTFYDYRTIDAVKRKMGWRIDMMLCTPPLASRCTDCFIDLKPRLAARPSDHTYLVADFDL